MSIKSKLMNHKDTVSKQAVQWCHEDHITDRGNKSLAHGNLARKSIPIPQAMKIPDAKAAVNRAAQIKELSSLARIQCNKEERGCRAGTQRRKDGSLCYACGLMSSQEFGFRKVVPKIRRPCCLTWRRSEG